MSYMSRLGRSLSSIASDLKVRNGKQLRELLPGRETTSTLRYIRACACKSKKPELICARWPAPDPLPDDNDNIPVFLLDEDPRKIWNSDYKCSKQYCQKPAITIDQMLDKLRIVNIDEGFDDREWRRHANEGKRISVKSYTHILIYAHLQGWLTYMELQAKLFEKNNVLIAIRSSTNFIDRIIERNDFKPLQEAGVDKSLLLLYLLRYPSHFLRGLGYILQRNLHSEFNNELEKQNRLIEIDATKILLHNLNRKNIPVIIKDRIKYVLSVCIDK